jgi:hypothetical protein
VQGNGRPPTQQYVSVPSKRHRPAIEGYGAGLVVLVVLVVLDVVVVAHMASPRRRHCLTRRTRQRARFVPASTQVWICDTQARRQAARLGRDAAWSVPAAHASAAVHRTTDHPSRRASTLGR